MVFNLFFVGHFPLGELKYPFNDQTCHVPNVIIVIDFKWVLTIHRVKILWKWVICQICRETEYVLLLVHCGVSAPRDSGGRGLHQAGSQQLVPDVHRRTELTWTESETLWHLCLESSAFHWSHTEHLFESCCIVRAVCCSLPPEETAGVCCSVRMTQADWGPLSSPCSGIICRMFSYRLFTLSNVSDGN